MAIQSTSAHRVYEALERFFELSRRKTSPRQELLAGVTTFMTMAYIIFVNPLVLSGAGMPREAVVAATCVGALVPTLLMGLWANYPFALASGMGLNAALVAQAMQPGMNWRILMGVIVIEGTLVTLLVLTGARKQVMQAIPLNLKRAIGVGIGVFIAFLGLQQMGWVTKAEEGAFLTHGHFAARPTLVAGAGLLLIAGLLANRVPGAILIGILGTAVMGALSDFAWPSTTRLMAWPERIFSAPDFSTFGQMDILGALNPALIGVIFAFLVTDFFDTMGTVIGVAAEAGFLSPSGDLPRLNRVLLVDSLGAIWGGVCGASSVTTYIESAAGVSEGGRTGLVSVIVGGLFLAAMFLSPVIGAVPAVATAPALVIVGFLMMTVIREMDLTSADEGLPAFLVMILIPLSQSISTGIGIGFISFVCVKLLRGQAKQVSRWMYGIAAVFAASFFLTKG